MRQQTITKWISEKEEEKYYFVSVWNSSLSNPVETYWTKEKPKKYWKKMIKIGYREVILYSSYIPTESDYSSLFELEKYTSFLLSHLQKCVRRNNYRMAVHTAEILLEVSPISFLRRLPIIMIEDSYIHYSLHTIIWLLCIVSNGYTIEDNQKKWLLGVVYIISSCIYKEYIETSKFVFSKKITNIHMKQKEIQNIVYSLEARRVYGGMKGDKTMIESYMNHYYTINTVWDTLFYKKVIPIYQKSIISKQYDWVYEAYDFHCSSFLLDTLECEYPQYSKEEYKEMIWKNSSSITYKQVIQFQKNMYIPYEIKYTYIQKNWPVIKSYLQKKANAYVYYMIQDIHQYIPEIIQL